jgi:Fis family transcriptional regulator
MSKAQIEQAVRDSLSHYFKDLKGTEPSDLHGLFISVVEKPLLDEVMKQANGNQSRAATWLGVNRNTLRKKLQDHGLI